MEVTNANIPSAPIDVPMLITHGSEDSLIPVGTSETVFQTRCADGEDITFVRYPQTDHDSSEQAGLFVIGWLEDRLEGRSTGSNCEPS
jgi:predicted esterase